MDVWNGFGVTRDFKMFIYVCVCVFAGLLNFKIYGCGREGIYDVKFIR